MTRYFAPLGTLVLCAVAGATLQAAVPELERFDQRFREVLIEQSIPGGAYIVVGKGQVLRSGAHGVRQIGQVEPVDVDTVFRLASVSKTFAGPLALQLVAEQRIDLADSLVTQPPDFRLKPALMKQLRVEDLLGQSTGLVANAYDNLLDDGLPLAKILPQFRTLEPICAPGRCYSYQNIAFAQIAPILSRAAGTSYSELVTQRLFDPLGMRSATFGRDALLAEANVARPHRRRDGVWVPAELNEAYYQLPAAAGINASVNDLSKWLLAMLGSHPDVLPAELIEATTRKRVRTPRELKRQLWADLLSDAHYGLGWRIYQIGEDELYLHSGWVRGYVTEIAYSRKHDLGLALLLNGETLHINRISTWFWATTHGRSVPGDPMPAASK